MTFSFGNNLSICVTKQELISDFSGTPNTLNGRIKRALRQEKLLQLKNGLYVKSTTYLHEPDKVKLTEFIASQMYQPSYISLEYALETYGLLASRPHKIITCITVKPTHTFKNFLGTYHYSNIKPSLFTGFKEQTFHGHAYRVVTKAKALFDYLYLDSGLDRRNKKHLQHQLFKESGLQWNNFSEKDFKEFDAFVWKSNSAKMMTIWHILNDYFEKKKFDVWAKELLA